MYPHCTNRMGLHQVALIEKRGKKWRALVRLKGHPTASKTFNGRKAAEDWARAAEDALRGGTALPQESITLSALIDRYVKEMSKFRPVSATKRGNLKRWEESLGDREVASLTGQDILTHIGQRKAGPATMTMELGFLGEVLAAGRSLWGMTIPDVVASSRPVLRRAGAIAKPVERDRRPTGKELDDLAAFFRFNLGAIPMRDLIPFAIDSAMRMGEIVALRWEDYRSGDKPTIQIRDRKDPMDKRGNNQWVPLLGQTVEIIERQQRAGPLIFPYKPDSIGAAFRRACMRLQIEDLHFHDLRHEGASRLFERGYSIPEVAIVTGHRDWKSLKRYTNLTPESLHRDPKAG
ncbi:putative phage integrase protein [Xanthomonas albilineans GPE PC73]|uniref:Putative phage integrase protein n=1 Tax=Xanthomonas albilineans (strain GPE PC73 / CFBP 7063) TaxID=380358 RepID=D2UAN0_XANAP|nr:putative phage integrase protein [Xanthomonas albilineans GPE PC73]